MRTCLYSSRNRQVPTVPYQPFLPAIQRSDDGSSLTFRPQETQPFLPAIQRSADGSPNSRESTQSSSPHQSPLPPVAPHPHHYLPPGTEQPGRRHPRHPPSTTKKSAPQPIQTTKNALLIPSAYNHTQSPTISIQ